MRALRYQLPKPNTSFFLNVTSMTDMFTIMLVFLLQTYSTNPFELTPEKGIRMPSSSTELAPSKAVKVSIGPSILMYQGKTLTTLGNGVFAGSDLDKEDPNLIPKLLNELKSQNKEGKEPDGNLVVEADRSLSYATLRKVMYTASIAGYPKVKLATLVSNK